MHIHAFDLFSDECEFPFQKIFSAIGSLYLSAKTHENQVDFQIPFDTFEFHLTKLESYRVLTELYGLDEESLIWQPGWYTMLE